MIPQPQVDPAAAAAAEYDASAAAPAEQPVAGVPAEPGVDAGDDVAAEPEPDAEAKPTEDEEAKAAQPGDLAPFDPETQERIAAHIKMAAERNPELLRERFGKELPKKMRAANLALKRFAPGPLITAIRDNPVFHVPDVVEMFAAVGEYLQTTAKPAPPTQPPSRWKQESDMLADAAAEYEDNARRDAAARRP